MTVVTGRRAGRDTPRGETTTRAATGAAAGPTACGRGGDRRKNSVHLPQVCTVYAAVLLYKPYFIEINRVDTKKRVHSC